MNTTWGKLSSEEIGHLRSRIRKRAGASDIEARFAGMGASIRFRTFRRKLDVGVDAGDLADKGAESEMIEVSLIPAAEFDYEPILTQPDMESAAAIDDRLAGLREHFRRDPVLEFVARAKADKESWGTHVLPASVDHRPSQSSVKNQIERGTCVAHASCACLEAYPHIPDDLSEQYLHYKFNVFTNQPQDQDGGIRTTDAAGYLARSDGRTCLESEWPYIPTQSAINALVNQGTYSPPQAALDDQSYGLVAYKIITDAGLAGESIKNTSFLEALLFQGYNVVVGTWVSWADGDENGILDPVLDSNGNPIGKGGHAMLIVGYDRNNQYFIVKNSWGVGWEHSGYAYLHYDLARSCFKYGYVVDQPTPRIPESAELPRG